MPASTFATILLALTLPDEELIERRRRAYEAFNRGTMQWGRDGGQCVERLVLRRGGKVARVENFLPHEEAEAQRAFRAP